ncbi:MAG: serine/threonine-protein kinase [Myxococcota bacterium]
MAPRDEDTGSSETKREGASGETFDTDTDAERIGARVRARLLASAPQMAWRIGRYQVLETIGHGGMGTVHAAYDEQLDRKVAIKVLLEDGAFGPEEHARLIREAQALARLSHPNVVAVHEVGEHDGDLFLAMEFVRGESLAKWLSTNPDWQKVLKTYVEAGRGLAEAHRVDLVHRDFKPLNVMRSDDGAVKVLDFGLASVVTEPSTNDHDAGPISSSFSESLTIPGTVMGTPPYMSPEQHQGDGADARSDQYSFCVALWEALTGARPFAAKNVQLLYEDKLRGPPSWPRSAAAVPRSIVEALRRGLAPDADHRWPSMEPLLDALTWDPGRRRLRGALALAGVSVVGLGGVTLYTMTQGETACTGAEAKLAGVWDDARQAEVQAAVQGIDEPYAQGVWARTQRALDDYASAWVAMHTEACEATSIRGEQSAHMLDLRMACLQRAAVDLQTTVDTLASADEAVVRRAHRLTARLPPLAGCADTQALSSSEDPPRPEDASAVEVARLELSRSESLERAGRYPAARDAVESARSALEGVDYGPVNARLALRDGLVKGRLGDFEAAEASLNEAVTLASQWNQRDSLAQAAIGLLEVVGYQLREAEGLRYWSIARGASTGQPRRMAEALTTHALALSTLGKLDEAEAEHRAAIELQESTLGPDHPDLAGSHNNLAIALAQGGKLDAAEVEFRATVERRRESLGLEHPESIKSLGNLGNVLAQQGKLAEAEAITRQALSLAQRALGPRHPEVALRRGALGHILSAQGKVEEAETETREALALAEAVLGPEHPDVTMSRYNLGAILQDQLRFAEAEAEFRAATAQWLKQLGPEHPDVALGRSSLGAVLEAQGKHEEAETALREAVQLREKALGPDHPSLAFTRQHLALTLVALGKLEEAEAELRASLSISEEALGAEHPQLSLVRSDLASVLIERGRVTEALPLAEKAQPKPERDDVPADVRAYASFVLGRALWDIEPPQRDRLEARKLAEAARQRLKAAEATDETLLREVEQWLTQHPAP